MRRLLALIAGGLLAVAVAAPSAQALPFTGTLSLVISTLPGLLVPGAGSGASVGGGIASITSGGFGPFDITVPITNATNGT